MKKSCVVLLVSIVSCLCSAITDIGKSTVGGALDISIQGRQAFLRMEKDAQIPFRIVNTGENVLKGLKVECGMEGLPSSNKNTQLNDLAPKASFTWNYTFDTNLMPGEYHVTVTVSDGSLKKTEKFSVFIAKKPLPEWMPVIMWGQVYDCPMLAKLGFTHAFCTYQSVVNWKDVWKSLASGKNIPEVNESYYMNLIKRLDDMLINGIYGIETISLYMFKRNEHDLPDKYLRQGRDGKPYAGRPMDVAAPEFKKMASIVSERVSCYLKHPAYQGALLNTEIRDHTEVSFNDVETGAFRKYAGYSIPAEIVTKYGVDYKNIRNFPPSRIISDSNPILNYYKWFWKGGDGWPVMNTALHEGFKKHEPGYFWTFTDPATRVPPIWGANGKTDVISNWTYTYPDPIKIGQATDELFAMAEGSPGQQVMKMTQVIWYRSATAPKEEKPVAEWEKQAPDAQYITIAPDFLREAFWCKISRPVKGIMYHGYGSLHNEQLYKGPHHSYVYTNAGSKGVLKSLVDNVVHPLGPMLLNLPDRKPEVKLLESFTSSVFGGRWGFGYSYGWVPDAHLILQWAHLQPGIIYEESILQKGLSDCDILLMPSCCVLTESVYDKIKKFQERGGIVIGDETLVPAVIPDIRLESYRRTGDPEKDKKHLQRMASDLRKALEGLLTFYTSASSQDIITRVRTYGSSDYLFVVNDKRTFGDYVGQHRKVMEKGLPIEGKVEIGRSAGAVYDLVKHSKVDFASDGKSTEIPVSLGPGGGTVFLVTDSPVSDLDVDVPEKASQGESIKCEIAVNDSRGKPVDAVIPVELRLTGPSGIEADESGYYAAKNGHLEVPLDFALNETPGEWQLVVKDLASGLRMVRKIKVSSENWNGMAIKDKRCLLLKQVNATADKLDMELIRNGLKDGSPLIRNLSLRLLAGKGAAAMKDMEELLKSHPDSGVRIVALEHICKYEEPEKFLPVLAAALNDKDITVSRYAADIISRQDTSSPEVIRILKDAEKNKDSYIRNKAFNATWPFYKEVVLLRDRADYDHDVRAVGGFELPLDGWKICADKQNKGHLEKWFTPGFDDAAWNNISIGIPWQKSGIPALSKLNGIAWYRLRFKMPEKVDCAGVEINFGAVDQEAWVWLNGKYAGQHILGPSGWNKPFSLDITNEVEWNKENQLTVRVSAPGKHGGIWKGVNVSFLK